MDCVTECRCRCGQSGCSCHRSTAGHASVITWSGPSARCNMCGRTVPAQYARSPLGRVVTAIFCPGCDVAHPR
jgi:hypothetical protein